MIQPERLKTAQGASQWGSWWIVPLCRIKLSLRINGYWNIMRESCLAGINSTVFWIRIRRAAGLLSILLLPPPGPPLPQDT